MKNLIIKVENNVGHITLNRPNALNALTYEMISQIEVTLDYWLCENIDLVIIDAVGEKAFCAGGDMNWESTEEFQDHEYEFHIHLTKCSKPIIAKVDGYAIGGGNHMAYFCDLTIASENSIFGQNGPRVGSPAGGAIVAHSANILGHKRAREMWMTCKRYSAKEMMNWGLVNSVVQKEKLDEDELEKIISKVKKKEISGINVTVPFKKAIIPFLDELSAEAKSTQSVNTIYLRDNKVIGHNTDIFGFETSIKKSEYNLTNKEVLILGAGGVVPSIIYALNKLQWLIL